MDKQIFLDTINNSDCISEVCRNLNWNINGTTYRKIKKLINEYDIDTSHFDRGSRRSRKYNIVIKNCPVCGNEFKTRKGNPREKQTCSHSCANTFFRSMNNNPNWTGKNYVKICFAYHEKKCVCCNETKIVEVHHLDHDNTNNDPKNLVPLCPTHHQYWHSRYRKEVEKQVLDYVKGLNN